MTRFGWQAALAWAVGDFRAGQGMLWTLLLFTAFALLAALAACLARVWRHRTHERAWRASRLEAELLQAQNQALRMQLQPHFLFNTLHAISTLMHKDVGAADRMVTRLGDLLRLSLEREGEQETSLGQELDLLAAYLEIEQIRFTDRLRVDLDVPDALRRAWLPAFILPPLVENALKHGFSKRSGAGALAIRARESDGSLVIEVEDDGAGPPAFHQEGVGLRSVRERLHLLYGESARFAFTGLPGRGTLAAITLPLRLSGPQLNRTPP